MEAIIKFLCDKVETCQLKGAFSLKDAYILKECVDLLVTGKCSNPQINKQTALDAVSQALNLSQTKGCFNLEEAHELFAKLESLQRQLQKEDAESSIKEVVDEVVETEI